MLQTKAKYLFLVFSLCCFYTAAGQDVTLADSLRQALSTSSPDSNKVNLLNDLAWELKFSDGERARVYLDSSIRLSQLLSYKKGEAQAYNNRGVVETIDGNYNLAIGFYEKALTIRNQLGDKKGVASLYNNIGNLHTELNDHVTALVNFRKSLRLREDMKDTIRAARIYYNIGLVHENMGNYPEALDFALKYLSTSEGQGDEFEIANAENLLGNIKSELERHEEAEQHYLKSLQLREKLGDEWELAISYNNFGNAKDTWGEQSLNREDFEEAKIHFNEALEYYGKALKIYEAFEDENGLSMSFNNIGLVHKNIGSLYLDLKDAEKASEHFKIAHSFLGRSLEIREKLADKKGIMEVYNGIGDVLRRERKLDEALIFTYDYLAIAEELSDQKFIQQAYKDLSRVYAEMENYKQAYHFRKKYDELRYARLDEDRVIQIARREAIFGDEKKQREIDEQKIALQLQESQLSQTRMQRNSIIAGALGLFLIALLLLNRYRFKSKVNEQLEKKNKIIEIEQKKSDDLLLNILPAATAEELKQHGKAKAKYYDSVTVLFSDFEAFTNISEKLPPEDLVSELDNCFRAFDNIVGKYGIEKIKTIGDAYMCAGGLPSPSDSHPVDVVNAAIEMLQFVGSLQANDNGKKHPAFRVRIGIHTGPVVAGIVGSKKFAFDIWGDTVNIASRMESGSEAGRINISQNTYDLVKDHFDCTYRGKIKAKNKGEIDMYFIETKVPASARP